MPSESNISMLVLDQDQDQEINNDASTSTPKNFRMSSSLKSEKGLENLNVAGSAQFSKKSLQNALSQIPGKVWIIDLRQESHGFVNGIPISWYSNQNQSNIDESDDNIQRLESMLFRDLSKQPGILVNKIVEKKDGIIGKTQGYNIKIDKAQTESSLVNELNLNYLRVGVLDHHAPDDDGVDTFVELAKSIPKDAWLYFHCRGGKGRTTTLMVMYDIFRNAPAVSLEEIVKRQARLGGSDLFTISEDPEDAWKKEAAIQRKEFIAKFYKYVVDPKGMAKQSWTDWSKTH